MSITIKHKGMEWVWCGDGRTNQYRYVDPLSKDVWELDRQYLGLWGREGYYWVLDHNEVQVDYFKSIRTAMSHAHHLLMKERAKSAKGRIKWIHADKPEGSTWFLAVGFAPYVEMYQAEPRGKWRVKDCTSRRHTTCHTFKDAKQIALMWLTEKELER